MKYTYNGAESVIIFEKEISEYYDQPYDAMYNDLLAIKKDEYAPDEQIIITAYKKTDKSIWKHFYEIIHLLDIPTFFVHIKSNDKNVGEYIHEFCHDDINFEKTGSITVFERSDSFCITPFINAEVDVDGTIKPCCIIQTNPNYPNIKNTTLDAAYQSQLFQQIRQDFINGSYPEVCEKCWQKEKLGITSKRQRDKSIHNREYYTTDIFQESKIKSMDLKIGFQCNLKCRICYNGVSSAWYAEDKKYQNVPSIHEIDYMFDAGKDFWINQIEYFDEIEHISMKGGEPLLDRTHLKMLEKLLNLGKKDVKIHYNTNGTIFPEKHLEVLNEFDNVAFTLSIDNIGEKFEYERNGVAWEKVRLNLENFSKLDRNKYRIDFFTTVSLINVLDLTETMSYGDKLNFKHELNYVDGPEYFSIYNIPVDKRQHIIDYLDSSPYERVREVSARLKQDTYNNLNDEFWLNINAIDLRRNQNFAKTYPEMASIMSL
jgi:MoaA/NifB/PqqE/SkfB family radical SAM enzyme